MDNPCDYRLIESAPVIDRAAGKLWLPLRSANAAVPTANTSADGQSKGMSARLMLVEDDPLVREVIAEQLISVGYFVLALAGGFDALAATEAGEEVHLLVADLSMPTMHGMTVIREARQRRPGLPATLLTGFAS